MSNDRHMLCFSAEQRLDDDEHVIGIDLTVFDRDFNPLEALPAVPQIISRARAFVTSRDGIDPSVSKIAAVLGQDNVVVVKLLYKLWSELGNPEEVTPVVWSHQLGHCFQLRF